MMVFFPYLPPVKISALYDICLIKPQGPKNTLTRMFLRYAHSPPNVDFLLCNIRTLHVRYMVAHMRVR